MLSSQIKINLYYKNINAQISFLTYLIYFLLYYSLDTTKLLRRNISINLSK